MKCFFYFLLVVILSSCVNNDDGPCEWHERKFKATVTNIEFDKFNAAGDSTFKVIMEFDAGSLSEKPQNLADLKNMEITSEKLRTTKLKVNHTYTGKINDLKSGNCETPIVGFDQRLN